MDGVPEFGERVPGMKYRSRPGSYGIVLDSRGRIAVMRTPTGLHLPGGGANPGESESETLAREILEECGHAIGDATLVCRATQYVHARGEGYFAKQCAFFRVSLGAASTTRFDTDHELVWMPASKAMTRLSSEAQRWAVAQALGKS